MRGCMYDGRSLRENFSLGPWRMWSNDRSTRCVVLPLDMEAEAERIT